MTASVLRVRGLWTLMALLKTQWTTSWLCYMAKAKGSTAVPEGFCSMVSTWKAERRKSFNLWLPRFDNNPDSEGSKPTITHQHPYQNLELLPFVAHPCGGADAPDRSDCTWSHMFTTLWGHCAGAVKQVRLAVMGKSINHEERPQMLVDAELGERLSHYCKITKQTQEQAGNQAAREMLTRPEQGPRWKHA